MAVIASHLLRFAVAGATLCIILHAADQQTRHKSIQENSQGQGQAICADGGARKNDEVSRLSKHPEVLEDEHAFVQTDMIHMKMHPKVLERNFILDAADARKVALRDLQDGDAAKVTTNALEATALEHAGEYASRWPGLPSLPGLKSLPGLQGLPGLPGPSWNGPCKSCACCIMDKYGCVINFNEPTCGACSACLSQFGDDQSAAFQACPKGLKCDDYSNGVGPGKTVSWQWKKGDTKDGCGGRYNRLSFYMDTGWKRMRYGDPFIVGDLGGKRRRQPWRCGTTNEKSDCGGGNCMRVSLLPNGRRRFKLECGQCAILPSSLISINDTGSKNTELVSVGAGANAEALDDSVVRKSNEC